MCWFKRKVTVIAIKVMPLNSYCGFDGTIGEK